MNQFDWEPEIKIVRFAAEDVIATSGFLNLDEDEVAAFIFRR